MSPVPSTYVPNPQKGVYAVATLVLSESYVDTALQLCQSIGKTSMQKVVFVATGDASAFRSCRCFDEVREIGLVDVPGLHKEPRLSSQLTKFGMMLDSSGFDRVLYLDADITVVNTSALEVLVATPMKIGFVYSGVADGWRSIINGGVFVYEPNATMADDMLMLGLSNKWDDQLVLNEYMADATILPEIFNVMLGRERETIRMWEKIKVDAAVFHFMVGKPWEMPAVSDVYPYSRWHANMHMLETDTCPGYRRRFKHTPRTMIDGAGATLERLFKRRFRKG